MGLFDKTVLGDKFANLKRLQTINLWLDSFDSELKEFVLKLIQYDQLIQKGIRDDGSVIGYYSELTEEINPSKKAGTPYTLLDTGEFFNSMFVQVLSDGFIVDADDEKTGKRRVGDEIQSFTVHLFELYGNGIVGLTEDSKEEFLQELRIKMIEKCREYVTQA
jgi:hypothetical protein